MIATITTTIQKKNTTIPGIACPATVLVATARQLPRDDLLNRRFVAVACRSGTRRRPDLGSGCHQLVVSRSRAQLPGGRVIGSPKLCYQCFLLRCHSPVLL